MGRIVVIGTDNGLAEALEANANLRGHIVDACRSELATLTDIRRTPADVVITNPATPVRDSMALVEELNRIRPGIRTILLAPELTDADVVGALKAQVFAAYKFPADPREIADMAATALKTEDWRRGIEVVSGLPTWMTLRVACGLVSADRITRFLTEWESALPADERDLLMTAFREMVLNAMEHGAGFDPGQVIEVVDDARRHLFAVVQVSQLLAAGVREEVTSRLDLSVRQIKRRHVQVADLERPGDQARLGDEVPFGPRPVVKRVGEHAGQIAHRAFVGVNGQPLVPAQVAETPAIVQAHDVVGVRMSEQQRVQPPNLLSQRL